jgi:hypothetical protein
MHETMRGCFYDFCLEKGQLDFKLRTGDICGDCMDVFTKIGVPEELLTQAINIMESLRRSTVSTGPYLSSQDDYNRWPFPVAVTRHKASQAINATNRLKLLLDHLPSAFLEVDHKFVIETFTGPLNDETVDRISKERSAGVFDRASDSCAGFLAEPMGGRRRQLDSRNERLWNRRSRGQGGLGVGSVPARAFSAICADDGRKAQFG